MAWKFIYTYRERCKTWRAHNWCWNWSPFTSKHTGMCFSKLWNTFPEVSKLTAWILWRVTSSRCSTVRGVFLYTLPFNRAQRKKSAGVRSTSPCLYFLANFWMKLCDGACLSPNSVRNAVWYALNERVCQYLRKRNPRYSDNNNNNIYLLQLGCYSVAVFILHVNKTLNWLLLNLSWEGYMRSM